MLKKAFFIYFLLLWATPTIWGQKENFLSRSSLGPTLGGSYYIGDLNPYRHFQNTHISGGLIYRYTLNSRVALNGKLLYGKVSADDANSNFEAHRLRNLSFESTIYELSGGIEFNYFNYKLGDEKFFFSPYMFVNVGFFRMNPSRELNDEMIALQPLGTEGQGSDLNEEQHYSLTQFVIPFGIGFKLNITEKMSLSLEYGIRKTFTDYIDDVGGNYVDPSLLTEANGNLAARMADPSLEGFEAVGPRGNAATKDWYSIFGVMVTFPLGNEGKCHFKNIY